MVMPILTPNGPFGGVTIFGHEALAVTSSPAVGLTASVFLNATVAIIICETAPVRYWTSAAAPTAATPGNGPTIGVGVPTTSVGKILNPGDQLVITGHDNIVNIAFIAVSASATLQTEYGR